MTRTEWLRYHGWERLPSRYWLKQGSDVPVTVDRAMEECLSDLADRMVEAGWPRDHAEGVAFSESSFSADFNRERITHITPDFVVFRTPWRVTRVEVDNDGRHVLWIPGRQSFSEREEELAGVPRSARMRELIAAWIAENPFDTKPKSDADLFAHGDEWLRRQEIAIEHEEQQKALAKVEETAYRKLVQKNLKAMMQSSAGVERSAQRAGADVELSAPRAGADVEPLSPHASADAESSSPRAELPLVFIDTETGGLSPEKHQLLEIVCIITSPDASQVIRRIGRRVLPYEGRSIDPGALKINGIDPYCEAWRKTAKPLRDALVDLLDKLPEKYVLVAHNAPFDVRFLNDGCAQAGLPAWSVRASEVRDTKKIAEPLKRHLPGLRLEHLCAHYGVHNAKAHSALADTEALIQVYRAMQQDPLVAGLRGAA